MRDAIRDRDAAAAQTLCVVRSSLAVRHRQRAEPWTFDATWPAPPLSRGRATPSLNVTFRGAPRF